MGSASGWLHRAPHLCSLYTLRKLYALEKQSPLGAYLSPAELGRRVHVCVCDSVCAHRHAVCMACEHGVHGVRRLARLCSIVRFGEGRSIRNDSPFYLVLDGCITCVAFDDEQAGLHYKPSHTAPAVLTGALATADRRPLAATGSRAEGVRTRGAVVWQ